MQNTEEETPHDPLALFKQKICKEIVVTGACRGFAEFFALTHNPQPPNCEVTAPEVQVTDPLLLEYANKNPAPKAGKVLVLDDDILEKLQRDLTVGDLNAIDKNYEEASGAYSDLSKLFRTLDMATPNYFRHTVWAPYDTRIVGLTCGLKQPGGGYDRTRNTRSSSRNRQYHAGNERLKVQTGWDGITTLSAADGATLPFDITPLIGEVSNEHFIPLSVYYAEKAVRVYSNGRCKDEKMAGLHFNLGLSLLDSGFPVQALIPFSSFIMENSKNQKSILNRKQQMENNNEDDNIPRDTSSNSIIDIDEINERKIASLPSSKRAILSLDTEEDCAICEYIALESFVRVALVIIQEIVNRTSGNDNKTNMKQPDTATAALCSSPQVQVSKLVAHVGDSDTPYGTKIPTNYDTLEAAFTPKTANTQKNSVLKSGNTMSTGFNLTMTPTQSQSGKFITSETNGQKNNLDAILSNNSNNNNNNNNNNNFGIRTPMRDMLASPSVPQQQQQSMLTGGDMQRLECVLSLLGFCSRMSPFWQLSVTALELTAKTYHLMGRYEDAEESFILMREEAKKRDTEAGRSCATRALTGAAMFAAARGDLEQAKTLLEERVILAEKNYASEAKIDSAMDALGAALSLAFLKNKMNMIAEAAEQFATAWDIALFVGHGAKKPSQISRINTVADGLIEKDKEPSVIQESQEFIQNEEKEDEEKVELNTNEQDGANNTENSNIDAPAKNILAEAAKHAAEQDNSTMEESGQTQLARVGLGIATGIMKEDEVFRQIAEGNYEI